MSVSTMATTLQEEKKKDILALKQHEYCASNKYEEKKRKSHIVIYIFSISLLVLAVYARFLASKKEANLLHTSEWAFSEMKIAKGWMDLAKEKCTSLSFIKAVSFGLTVTIFTWMMIFFDSALPGKLPPTPFSPRILRKQSGHTFHSGYVLALSSGFIGAILLCWM